MRSKADGGWPTRELGSADRRPRKTDFLLLWNMKNGDQIRTQLAEKRLKLDSSSLYNEVAPTGPRPAHSVSRCSRQRGWLMLFVETFD